MTRPTLDARLDPMAYRPPPRSELPLVDWPRAIRALRRLVRDSRRTDQVFEIIEALSGPNGERCFQRFVRDPDGLRLLAARPNLIAALRDLDALEALPDGTLGREYARFMRRGRIDADGLVAADEDRPVVVDHELDEDRTWFFERLRDMHDLWHVLSGYGSDEAGEVANLAFSYAQLRSPGMLLIVAVGALLGLGFGPRWPRYLWTAYRRGARAGDLTVVHYEALLGTPLAEVRARLGVSPPERAHPDGVVAASRADLGPRQVIAMWRGAPDVARADVGR